MSIDAKRKEFGLALPQAPAPTGAYVPVVQTGNLLLLAETSPTVDGFEGVIDFNIWQNASAGTLWSKLFEQRKKLLSENS